MEAAAELLGERRTGGARGRGLCPRSRARAGGSAASAPPDRRPGAEDSRLGGARAGRCRGAPDFAALEPLLADPAPSPRMQACGPERASRRGRRPCRPSAGGGAGRGCWTTRCRECVPWRSSRRSAWVPQAGGAPGRPPTPQGAASRGSASWLCSPSPRRPIRRDRPIRRPRPPSGEPPCSRADPPGARRRGGRTARPRRSAWRGSLSIRSRWCAWRRSKRCSRRREIGTGGRRRRWRRRPSRGSRVADRPKVLEDPDPSVRATVLEAVVEAPELPAASRRTALAAAERDVHRGRAGWPESGRSPRGRCAMPGESEPRSRSSKGSPRTRNCCVRREAAAGLEGLGGPRPAVGPVATGSRRGRCMPKILAQTDRAAARRSDDRARQVPDSAGLSAGATHLPVVPSARGPGLFRRPRRFIAWCLTSSFRPGIRAVTAGVGRASRCATMKLSVKFGTRSFGQCPMFTHAGERR